MKQYIHKTITTLAIVLGCALVFSSCEKEEDLIDLALSETEVEVFVDEAVTVTITSGNGTYNVSSSNSEVANPELTGTSIRISGVEKGEANITVTDEVSGKSQTISVTVNSAIIDTSTERFRWTNTHSLEEANAWASSVLENEVAITHIDDKRQFILSWTGGYSVGDKTNATLEVLENGDSNVTNLSSLEIQSENNGTYAFTFADDSRRGELVVSK